MPYVCEDSERRLEETRAAGTLNGIEWLDVDGGHDGIPRQRTLIVHCLLPLTSDVRVRVVGGVRADPRLNPVRVLWAFAASDLAAHPDVVTQEDIDVFSAVPDPTRTLIVRTGSSGDFSTYRLVVEDPPVVQFDPRLSEVPFTFKVDCPSDFDCRTPVEPAVRSRPVPPISYLERDFNGLRRTLLDRLSLLIPAWRDRNLADVGIMLVELFAYLGDHLSYAQDSVATEAYLGTARRRTSIRRHARLLDYPMHEGVAARAWLALTADVGADGVVLPTGTEVTTQGGDTVFHTLHDVVPRLNRNEIGIYTWSNQRCHLPTGTTEATLHDPSGNIELHAGDVLLLEEVRGESGLRVDADPTRVHAVRLAADPVGGVDPLTGEPVLEVRWHDADALPFDLFVERPRDENGQPAAMSVVRGNVVLAEHGAPVGPETLPVVEDTPRYRPELARLGLAHAMPYVDADARNRPAGEAVATLPHLAIPVVELTDGTTRWEVRRDLLGSDRFDPEYVVEMDDDGRAVLRFGDDVSGRSPSPGTRFSVAYRLGGGRAGNVGRDSLVAFANPADDPVAGLEVRNPMPAVGGRDPEPAEQVRQWAPQAFRVQQRAVTDADYAEVTGRHAAVQRAAATRRWTGSWYTEFVTVDRRRGLPVDAAFRREITDYLERFRMAGYDVEAEAPIFVPLDIELHVCVRPGYFRSHVKAALQRAFSAATGFFHPDNFTFAQPVYLGRVIATAMAIDGVQWVDAERFQRWGRAAAGELAEGRITIGRLEVVQCESDPNQPENGLIAFVMKGGVE